LAGRSPFSTFFPDSSLASSTVVVGFYDGFELSCLTSFSGLLLFWLVVTFKI